MNAAERADLCGWVAARRAELVESTAEQPASRERADRLAAFDRDLEARSSLDGLRALRDGWRRAGPWPSGQVGVEPVSVAERERTRMQVASSLAKTILADVPPSRRHTDYLIGALAYATDREPRDVRSALQARKVSELHERNELQKAADLAAGLLLGVTRSKVREARKAR